MGPIVLTMLGLVVVLVVVVDGLIGFTVGIMLLFNGPDVTDESGGRIGVGVDC